MRIQVGNRVKFLNDVGGGVIKSFYGDKMALVETDDGFEVSVVVTELLPDMGAAYGIDEEPTYTGATKSDPKKDLLKEPVLTFEQKKYLAFQGEAFLALVPRNAQVLHVSNFDLYLINTANYSFSYSICTRDGKLNTLIKTGIVEPDTKIEIVEYSQTTIAKIKVFGLQGIFYKYGLGEHVDPVNNSFSVEDVSFYKIAHFTENDYFDEKALIMKTDQADEMRAAIENLRATEIHRVVNAKEKQSVKSEHKSPKNTVIEEVDLHIEEILENTSGLSNGEMLEAQMARFETSIETALRSKVLKIVFIHGVGNGRLRQELRTRLDRNYPGLRYQDASFKEYGYGATMVYLR